MKPLLLILLIGLFSNCNSQIFFVGSSYSYTNSSLINDSMSFNNLRKQTTFFNRSMFFGGSLMYTSGSRLSYYQANRYAGKLNISYSQFTYKTIYWTDSIRTHKNSFIDLSILFTKISTYHQTYTWEIGPSLTYYINQNRYSPSIIAKSGIYNHLGKRTTYSVLLTSGITFIPIKTYRVWVGFEVNMYYRLTNRGRR